MATQLKQTDFYTPAPRPNIHVVFSAGAAAIAVRETLAGLPEADRTLDEIAAWTDGVSPEMHALLLEADQRHAAYNAYYVTTHQPAEERSKQAQGTSDAAAAEAAYEAINDELDAMVDLASDAQSAVCRHPATNATDLRAKLAFMRQHQMADGMNWTDELLADAERIAAIGNSNAASSQVGPSTVGRNAADIPPPLKFCATDNLRSLLDQRNAVATWLNSDRDFTDAEGAEGCDALNRLENAISGRPAATADDAVAKLIMVAQVAAEGHEINETEAARAIVDARRLFDMGYVHRFLLEEIGERVPALSPVENLWKAAWDAHEAALAADKPINARHEQAKADGSMTDELEKEWDDSGTRMGDAEWALFETPAPDLSALLWKMTLIEPRGLGFDDDIARNFMSDVERLGGVSRLEQGR